MALGDPYITVAELKTYLGISDVVDDIRLGDAVNAASRQIEHFCCRQFNDEGSTSARVFRSDTGGLVRIADFSTVTGLVVKTGQTGAYATTITIDVDFIVEPLNSRGNEIPFASTAGAFWRLRSLRNTIFPTVLYGADPNVEVTARWGWSSIPEEVTQAAYIQSSRLFRRKDSPEGVLGGFIDSPVRVGSQMDPDVKMLLKSLVKHRAGRF